MPSSSFASTSAASSKSSSTSGTLPGHSSSSQSYLPPRRSHPANQTWPSIRAAETDLTTPELCSDNEVEREGDSSIDDRLPSTPPVVDESRLRQKVRDAKHREDADVEMEPPSRPQRQSHLVVPRTATSPRIRESDLFAKRVPTSPMPLDTPRKPRPPAKSVGRSTPKPKARHDHRSEDEDDPLSLSFSSPDVVALSAPRTTGQPRSSGKKRRVSPARERASRDMSDASARSGSHHSDRRRLTLDDELRDARARSLLREEAENFDLDSGSLVGVGTRGKRRGFLAHGGAGGLPVFMGKGYVEGVEESEDEDCKDDDDYVPGKKSGGGRSIPAATKRKSRR